MFNKNTDYHKYAHKLKNLKIHLSLIQSIIYIGNKIAIHERRINTYFTPIMYNIKSDKKLTCCTIP